MRTSFQDVADVAADAAGIEGWSVYLVEHVTGGWLAKGCVPNGVYQRGPKKGRPRYGDPVEGTRRTVVVSDEQMRAAAAAYESSGQCWDCKGSGEVFAGWSAAAGVSKRPCTRCNGTGSPGAPT